MGCGSSAPAVKDTAEPSTRPQAKAQSQRGFVPPPKDDGSPDADLRDSHTVIKHLGKGGTGDTYLYRDNATGEDVAIKLIKRPLPRVIMPNILREITIQADLGEGHLNVINAKEVMLTKSHLALVMEYAAGGSLTSYVAERWQHAQHTGLFLSEDEARYFFQQFIEAVAYCHTHCVAHRDLKLDNTLLDDSDPALIKLCDFGFAKTWTTDSNMYTHIGTPVYMSPEQLNARNGMKGYDGMAVDVWASGVLLIVMLLGTFPFDHTEHPDPNTSEAHLEVWLQQVRSRWSEIPHIAKSIEKLTPECMDLLNRTFVLDEKTRITIAEVREHPWYKKPLLPKYQAAMARSGAEQKQIDAYIASRRISTARLAARNSQLKDLVDQASTRPPAGQSGRGPAPVRIDLRESTILEPASGLDGAAGAAGGGGGGAGLATMSEEEEAPQNGV